MGRLCERPGCSEVAAVTYGMRAEDLVFWIDVMRDSDPASVGVLCLRHADSMVVPRNWTLDDLRDPDLHLFRPPRVERTTERRRRRRSVGDDTGEQLRLGVDLPGLDDFVAADDPDAVTARSVRRPGATRHATGGGGGLVDAPDDAVGRETGLTRHATAGDAGRTVGTTPDEPLPATPSEIDPSDDAGAPAPWMPEFDAGDDLDGLLSASSPLLARAFRGDDRRR